MWLALCKCYFCLLILYIMCGVGCLSFAFLFSIFVLLVVNLVNCIEEKHVVARVVA